MHAGKLTKRITLQRPGGTRDSYGERATTWTDEATVWAAIEPMPFREYMKMAEAGGQEQAGALIRITLRYSSQTAAIGPDWRVKYGDRLMVLMGQPRSIDEATTWLELICSEGLREE